MRSSNVKAILILIVFSFSLLSWSIQDVKAQSVCDIAATAVLKGLQTQSAIKVTDILRSNKQATSEVSNYIRQYKTSFNSSGISTKDKIKSYIANIKHNSGKGTSYSNTQTAWKMDNRFQRLMNNKVFDKELIDAFNNRRQQLFVEELAKLLESKDTVANFKNYRSIEGLISGSDMQEILDVALSNSAKTFEQELYTSMPTVLKTLKKKWSKTLVATPANWHTVVSYETKQFGFFERQLLERLSKRSGSTQRTVPEPRKTQHQASISRRQNTTDRRISQDRTQMLTKTIENWAQDYDDYYNARLSVLKSLSSIHKQRGVFKKIDGAQEWTISEGCAHVIRKVQTTGSPEDRIALVTKAMNDAYQLTGPQQLTTEQVKLMITLYDKLDALLLSILKAEGMPSAPSGDFIHFAVDVKMAGALNVRIIAQELVKAQKSIQAASSPLAKAKAIHMASMKAEKIATSEMDNSIDGVLASLQEAYGDNLSHYVHSFIPPGEDKNSFYIRSGDDVFIYFFDTTSTDDIQLFTDAIASKKLGGRIRTASGLIKTDAEKGEDVSKKIEMKAMNLWGPEWQKDIEAVFYVHVEDGRAQLIVSGEGISDEIRDTLVNFLYDSV
ncbi:MAG: hypothetical protein ISR65_01670 [Bacteriovoracaceae bacterium]|nr:hypothetical protein [Bacteriovoracaceae bacterium]